MSAYNADSWRAHQVDIPEGKSGDWKIEKFSVTANELWLFNIRLSFTPGQAGREMVPGDYTRLMRGQCLIMSDTRAEIRDLDPFLRQLAGAKSVMIAGLGLGVCLRAAILAPSVEEITVFEHSEDVLALTEEHYERLAACANTSLTILREDIFGVRPIKVPREHYDVAWFDIWNDICGDNWREMKALKRRWRPYAEWVGCWCEPEVRYEATGRYR